ncbi:unnamed protein product [Closterium sp. NIES-65]|nr:unnamed protein product [Closterium sp. NIES-65]
MFTRGRSLLGVTVPAGADAWGDTSGHETVKAEEEEDLVSDTEDEEDGDDTCATKYTGVKLKKASGKFGVKILIKGGKRKQQRLGAYTSEEEAAFAYAADDGTSAESASSSKHNEEDGEADSDTSASASPEESGEPATGGKTADDGCAGTASPKANGRESRGAGETDVYRGEGRGHVDGHVDRACRTPVDTDGDDVHISSRVLKQLIRAQDRSAKENARLEALILNAMAQPSGGSRKRKARKQRDPEQGCMNPKRKRGETWSGGSDDDGEDNEEDTHGSGGCHMRTARSPILQRALAHLPTDKAWKVSGPVSISVHWAHDRDGMPFASRAFATCAKAAFKPKKAGLVMTLKVSVCVLYWEARKGRLSNSAGGNAHVVDGLKVLVKEAVERAIRIRNPEYDAEREAWIWGRHGLRISACGLEHMKPAAAAELLGIVGDGDLSVSVGA